ncbi:MAG: molybdopterin cofactor-binding domain-containing protein [Mycobacteriales bacterium]
MEPNSAVADVRAGSAEIWSELKSPIIAQSTIAMELGLPVKKVTVHVVRGGGSAGGCSSTGHWRPRRSRRRWVVRSS